MPRVCSKGMLVFSWRLAFRWPFFAKKNFKAENVMCIFNKGGGWCPQIVAQSVCFGGVFLFFFWVANRKTAPKNVEKRTEEGMGGLTLTSPKCLKRVLKTLKNSLHCREWRNSIGCVGSYDAKPAEVSGCSCIHCSTMLEGCLFWDGIAKPWLL